MAKPRRATKEPAPGSRLPSQILGDNIRSYRLIYRMKQSDVAERMTALGHKWYPTTVGEVERGLRSVTIDELVGLAVVLRIGAPHLLDPAGPADNTTAQVDIGLPDGPVSAGSIWSAVAGDRPAFYIQWSEDNAIEGIRRLPSPETEEQDRRLREYMDESE